MDIFKLFVIIVVLCACLSSCVGVKEQLGDGLSDLYDKGKDIVESNLKIMNPILQDRLRRLNTYDSSTDIATSNFETLMHTIEAKDSNSLKEMFSSNALASMGDYDSVCKELFDFIDGNVVSWEMSKNHSQGETIQYGEKHVEVRTHGTIITDTQEYNVYVVDNIVDDFDANNKGLHSLKITTSDYSYYGETIPGITIPQLSSELNSVYESFKDKAKLDFESAMTATQMKDSNALKKLFSDKALSKADDFEVSFEKLFDFIGADIVSWEIDKCCIKERDRQGENNVEIMIYGKLITDTQEYGLCISNFIIDNLDDSNKGIYTVEVASYDYEYRGMNYPGISLPQLRNRN